MECEQCQIAQASTIRETETATGLIYYWRKTEIKCSATACETYGAHIVPTTFVSPFVFNIFFFFLPFTLPRTWPLPLPLNPVVILLTNWNAILSILSRHRYNTAYRTKRLSSAARVKCVSLKRHQRPDLSCPSFSFRFDTTLPECNARVYKHSSPKMHRMSHGGETKTQRLFERVGKASSMFNFARFF